MTSTSHHLGAREALPLRPAHITGLDGLRALSILLVILSHAGVRNGVPGGFGVTVFFFISGYLITSLLMKEYQLTNRINITRFFIRRALRLLPASLLFIAFGTALLFLFGGVPRPVEPFAAIFYFANYYEIFVGFTLVPNTHLSPYNVLWSLAVEEHFYIIAAPLFALAYPKSTRRYTVIVLIAVVAPLLIRTAFVMSYTGAIEEQIYTFAATECRLDSIAYGALLAILLPKKIIGDWLVSRMSISMGCALLIISFAVRDPVFRETIRYSIQGLGLLFIVPLLISQRDSNFAQAILNTRLLVWIGKLSYSLYLFHWISLITTTRLVEPSPYSVQWQLVFWAQTICLSSISYYFVEQKFVRMRTRFASV